MFLVRVQKFFPRLHQYNIINSALFKRERDVLQANGADVRDAIGRFQIMGLRDHGDNNVRGQKQANPARL